MHKIFFDTETTGLHSHIADRIVEVGAAEFDEMGRFTGRKFHTLINPERDSSPEALAKHGHTTEVLRKAPKWAEVNDEFCEFVRGAALYAHNADFDTGFINMEMAKCESKEKFFDIIHNVTNTQTIFGQMDPAITKAQMEANPNLAPGPKNFKLDTFMERYGVTVEILEQYGIFIENRNVHGALLDSFLLAETYFRVLQNAPVKIHNYDMIPPRSPIKRISADPNRPIIVHGVDEAALAAHREYLESLAKTNKADPLGLLSLAQAVRPTEVVAPTAQRPTFSRPSPR